jgi:hypothetical protein
MRAAVSPIDERADPVLLIFQTTRTFNAVGAITLRIHPRRTATRNSRVMCTLGRSMNQHRLPPECRWRRRPTDRPASGTDCPDCEVLAFEADALDVKSRGNAKGSNATFAIHTRLLRDSSFPNRVLGETRVGRSDHPADDTVLQDACIQVPAPSRHRQASKVTPNCGWRSNAT